MVFDPHVLEVTTHLKIALSVMEGMSSLFPLPLSQRLKKKEEGAFSATPAFVDIESYRNLGCYYGWQQGTASQNVISHCLAFGGDTSSSVSVGFFSKTPQ